MENGELRMTQKEQLFEKLKSDGIFWSYAKEATCNQIGDAIFIEHTLKYGDLEDIKTVFQIFEKPDILKVWKMSMRFDTRFKKLNLFLARMFFDMDVEADYFEGRKSDREKKLRKLATSN